MIGTLHSCSDQTPSKEKVNVSNGEAQPKDSFIEYKSKLRPNERLQLTQIYTDTVEFIGVNYDYDYWFIEAKKNKDTICIIIKEEQSDFVRGDLLSIRWKVDSTWIAGDGDRLELSEWLVDAKRIQPLKLRDKKVRFLWREKHYLEDLKGEFNVIVLNEEYIKTISEPEKIALAFVATFIGNECDWDGQATDDRSNLNCKIISALAMGYQCSNAHLEPLRYWFRNDQSALKELENCPTTPYGATVQNTFEEIDIAVQGNTILLSFKASGINIREGKSWHWTEKHSFDFQVNELLWKKKEVSHIEHKTFKVTGYK